MAAGVRRLVNQNQTAPRAEDVDEGGEGGREREQDLKAGRQRAARARRAGTTHELTAQHWQLRTPTTKLELPPNTIHKSTNPPIHPRLT
jgi:hypothetical protein